MEIEVLNTEFHESGDGLFTSKEEVEVDSLSGNGKEIETREYKVDATSDELTRIVNDEGGVVALTDKVLDKIVRERKKVTQEEIAEL